MIKVLICIQARSTSSRFPRKIFEKIDGVEVLQRVLDSCYESSIYINKYTEKNEIVSLVTLLIPHGDEIKERYGSVNLVFEGPENNVLERFYQANEIHKAHYIVRITSDCPLIPSYKISKAINVCVKNRFDYVSNVDPIARTCPDGHDVEVFSKRALDWAYNNALEEAEREHVTLILRSNKIPDSFKTGHIISHTINFGDDYKKLSLDTKEDFKVICDEYYKVKECLDNARKKSGPRSIYRI